MTKKQERNIIAAVGTIVFMSLVLLVLWLVHMSVYTPEEPDYIEVTLAPEEPEPPQMVVPKPKPVPSGGDPGASTPTKAEPNNEPTQTSAKQMESDDDVLAIRQQAIADSIAEANRKAKQKAENLIGGFTFSATEEQGAATTKTEQGGQGAAKKGEGTDGSNRWSLKGRGLVGSLPKPGNSFNQDGWIEVEISVDAQGNVIDASFKRGTISDAQTRQLAIDAAKKAKFTSDKSIKQVGTITYYFKFN